MATEPGVRMDVICNEMNEQMKRMNAKKLPSYVTTNLIFITFADATFTVRVS